MYILPPSIPKRIEGYRWQSFTPPQLGNPRRFRGPICHRHTHSEDLIFDPLHYLPLIEQKIGALDQAAPLAGWDLPEAFITLRRLLGARMGKAGKREYVQVLRLLETFRLEEVEGAVGDALRLGAIGFDAVKHLVLCGDVRMFVSGG